ncbi:MAG TPA: flagellar biosynthetic protein FliR [Candidatus Angelobacter sp.]|nr:flagellar biosynthetic protein FliR [Candidatus Angelobacter sp.]
MLPQIDSNTLTPMFLLGVRLGGLMTFAPFLGNASIPIKVKSGLTVVLTALLMPAYSSRMPQVMPENWVATIGGELMIGLGMGLTLELVFEGARFAGQLLGFQFGYSLVNVIDPQSEVEISVLNFFHYTILLLIFLQGDLHHWIFRLLVQSFDTVKPGTVIVTKEAMTALLQGTGHIFLMGLQLAAPPLIVTMMTDIALAFMAKASPQLPVLSVGLPAKMLCGYAAIWSSVVFWPAMAHKWFYGALISTEHLFKAMH